MTVTAQLVGQSSDNLRYLITADVTPGGGPVTISNAQLQSDTLAGPLWDIARAKTRGIGSVLAGTPLTQNQVRDILCADSTGAIVGNKNVPRALLRTVPRTGPEGMQADADVDVDGNPIVIVTMGFASSTGYLDIIHVVGVGPPPIEIE